jgi:formylglycine-generating enzyme required for sulfatase activity
MKAPRKLSPFRAAFALVSFILSFAHTFGAEKLIDANIAPTGTNNSVLTIWDATPGRTYRLEATTNLTAPWLNALPGTLTASSNALSQIFPTDVFARFFRVLVLDMEGPEVYRTEPAAGGIAVSRSAALRAWLRDDSGIVTNTITLVLATPTTTNAPVTLADARLSFTNGLLTYTPTNTETLGAAGDIVTVSLAVADTLGNQTTNFSWSFQLELPPVASTNIVFIGGGGAPATTRLANVTATASTLTLVSSNGNTFLFSYTGGSSGVTNGLILVNSSLQSGYTVVVTNFTNYVASNTVVVITRPAKLAELLKDGSLVSQTFTQVTPSGGASLAIGISAGLPVNYHHDLAQVVYQDGGMTVELIAGSAFDWNGQLTLGANVRDFRLREFEATLSGTVTANLQARFSVSNSVSSSGTKAVIAPVTNRYASAIITPIGPVPVWVDVVYEIDAGYEATATASDSVTSGITASRDIVVSRRWSDAAGWSTPFESPGQSFSYTRPVFQAQVTANLKVYLQPKVTFYLYSVAGVSGDLQPSLELEATAQANPPEFDLSLYGALTSTMGLNLKVWDEAWGEQPSKTFELIPRTQLWHTNVSTNMPRITLPPKSVAVESNTPAKFFVEAKGKDPLQYRWYKNGLLLGDDESKSGTRTPTLNVPRAKGHDAANYTVEVRNTNGTVTTTAVRLSLLVAPTNMVLIPAGAFQMGDAQGDNLTTDEQPVHSVYVSAFHIDKYEVTKALWDDVSNWAITNGYSFNYGAESKAANHPAHSVTWYDAVKWCNARSEKEGRMPAYYTSSAQTTVYRSGQVSVDNSSVKWNTGYRLPTEAEWEKAARGGLSGRRFPWGDTISHKQANYFSHWSEGRPYYSYDVAGTQYYHPTYNNGTTDVTPYTSPVGSFAVNGYGLYDMAGNVAEWCWDWHGSYSSVSQSDPVGPASGVSRMFRGGSWSFNASSGRCADRFGHTSIPPDIRLGVFGLRCALSGASAL